MRGVAQANNGTTIFPKFDVLLIRFDACPLPFVRRNPPKLRNLGIA